MGIVSSSLRVSNPDRFRLPSTELVEENRHQRVRTTNTHQDHPGHRTSDFHQIKSHLKKCVRLLQEIDACTQQVGESMTAIHHQALHLYSEIRNRLDFQSLDPPDVYQEKLNRIEQDFNTLLALSHASHLATYFRHDAFVSQPVDDNSPVGMIDSLFSSVAHQKYRLGSRSPRLR